MLSKYLPPLVGRFSFSTLALACAAAFLAPANPAAAGNAGISHHPLGDRSKPGVLFAEWDSFTQTQVTPPSGTDYTFNGVATPASTLTDLSLVQSSAHALGAEGSGLLSGGDVYYAGTAAQTWTLLATPHEQSVNSACFQIKTANVNTNPAVISELFKPTIFGQPATYTTSRLIAGESILGNAVYVIEYRWTNLFISRGSPFAVTFSMPGGASGDFTRKPIDYISLDVGSTITGGTFAFSRTTSTANAPITADFEGWTTSIGFLNYFVFEVSAIDGSEIFVSSGNSQPFSLPVGLHLLRAYVFDMGGQVLAGEETITVLDQVDNTAPVVKILSPTGSSVSGNFSISGTVKDDLGLASFKVTFNGAPMTAPVTVTPNTTVPWGAGTVTAENGPNVLVVEAIDFGGHVTRVTKTLNNTNTGLAYLAGTYAAPLLPTGSGDTSTAGLVTITVGSTGSFTGKVSLGGLNVSISGVLQNDGVARFKPSLARSFDLIDRTEYDSYLGTLTLTLGTNQILTGKLWSLPSGGTELSSLQSSRSPFSKSNPVPFNLLTQPTTGLPTKGVYSAILTRGLEFGPEVHLHPQGTGYLSINLSSSGSASYIGYLPDGSKLSGSSKLAADSTLTVYAPLYRKRGVFVGRLTLDGGYLPAAVDGTNLLWIRPALPGSLYYPAGWPSGLAIQAQGVGYVGASSLFTFGPVDPINGNASLQFYDPANPYAPFPAVSKPVNINPGPTSIGQVKTIPAASPGYKLSISTSTGIFSGTYTRGKTTDVFRGIFIPPAFTPSHSFIGAGYGFRLVTPTVPTSGESAPVFISSPMPH